MLKSDLILIFVPVDLRGIFLSSSQDYNNLAPWNVFLEIGFKFTQSPAMGGVMQL